MGRPADRTQRTLPDPASARSAPKPLSLAQREDVNGARLLVSDIRTAFILANEIRYRGFERLFGIDRAEANLLTAVGALMLAAAARERYEKFMEGPALPSAGEVGLAAAVWEEIVQSVAGPASRETPLVGTLVTLAVLGGAMRPALARSREGAARAARQVHHAFRHRYGYLVGRQWRSRQWRS